MSHDEFTKLYRFMSEHFDAIDRRFESVATKESVDRLTGAVIAMQADIEDIKLENRIRDAQFGRLFEWGRKVGKKVDIPVENV